MFCKHCGHEVKEDELFCVNCGAKQAEEASNRQLQIKVERKVLIGAAVAMAILVIGLITIFGVKYWMQKQAKEQQKQWGSYVETLEKEVSAIKKQEEYYIFTEESQAEFEGHIEQITSGIQEKKSVAELEQMKKSLNQFVKTLSEDNQKEVAAYRKKLEGADVSNALDIELEQIKEIKKEIDTFLAEKNYNSAWEKLDEWDKIVVFVQNPNYDYTVEVEQYDLSAYPTITAYVNVRNESDEFVKGLDKDAFYVNEGRKIKGPFTKKKILKATHLNGKEGLSVGLVADVSGSMEAGMWDAKKAMIDFVHMLNGNDEVELTEFSEDSYTVGPFGTSFDRIEEMIDSMGTYGCTRLYDTLINELERVRSREKAKCVIAFTDGYNNCGYGTAQDVIDTAQAYHIPVFLIGIGAGCDESTLREIATRTGGQYHHIDDTSGLWDVYHAIYQQEQDVYSLQYEVDEPLDTGEIYSNIYIRTEDGHAGKAENFVFNTKEFFESMYNKFLIAGIDCQTKGERNLLDSGLITTTDKAYKTKECIAYQSSQAIKNGGTGSDNSNTFAVLLNHKVLNVEKKKDKFYLTASADYDISKYRKYSELKKNQKEKEYIQWKWGELDSTYNSYKIWIEENRTITETLTMVKDADGRWKFDTRKTDSTKVNEVYDAEWVD